LTDLQETFESEYHSKLAAAAPNSLSCFVEFMTPDEAPAAHHEVMCSHYEAFERRDIMRGLVSMPPGYAKTKFYSRYGPAWYLGKNPKHRYLSGGHSQAFAENEFGKYVRDIIDDPRYERVFPDVSLHPRSTAAGNWRLKNGRGGYVTKGVGQKIAGYRGHIGGADDLIGSREDAESEVIRNKVWDWLWADFRQRLLPKSPLFVVMTRWHPDDPGGRIEAMNKEGVGLPWDILNLTAIVETEEEMRTDPMGRSLGEVLWPDYYDVAHVLELKATLKPRDWYSLHKGKPRVAEGNMVKAAWFKRYDLLPHNQYDANGNISGRVIKRITISVDCAQKATQRANFTVISVWVETMDGRHYLAHVIRKRVEYNDMVVLIEDTARDWNAGAILVEDKGQGTTYIQARQGHAPVPIIPISVDNAGSKEFRFDGVLPDFEAGLVFLPKEASWLADYENELLEFPGGANDDQVDSTSQYLAWARKRLSKAGTQKAKGGGRLKRAGTHRRAA
jgi:predicted phage terminase large subunit-like protein